MISVGAVKHLPVAKETSIMSTQVAQSSCPFK